jgi:putative DNA primase/helicase
VTCPSLATLGGNFGLWPLLNKSVAIVPDARLSGKSDRALVVERLLSVSGEDAVTIDRKNQDFVTVKLPTRLVLVSNELPRLTDASGALASRMILLRLSRSWYGQEDTGLTEKLLAEMPGILLWAIGGWHRLQQRGHFVQPDSGGELVQEMCELGSPATAFVDACCNLGPDYTIPRGDLYEAYIEWCKAGGKAHVDDQAGFGRNLRAAFPQIGSSRPRSEGKRVWLYTGIRLKGGDF